MLICADRPDSTLKIQRMAALLSKKLGPEYLSTRAGGNAGKMTYIEGWRVIALANEVFGFNGWSSEIKDIHLDFVSRTSRSSGLTLIGLTRNTVDRSNPVISTVRYKRREPAFLSRSHGQSPGHPVGRLLPRGCRHWQD